jgi:four helix bundle protein
MRDHRKLEVFQLSHKLTIAIYGTTKEFPRSELYGLTSQMRRAAVSVSANIVEGAAKQTRAEYLRFLGIALGSLRELGYYLQLSTDLGLLSRENDLEVLEQQDHTVRKLVKLVQSLQRLDEKR